MLCCWITFGGSLGRNMTQSLAIDCLLLYISLVFVADPKLDFEFLVVSRLKFFRPALKGFPLS